MPPFKSPAIGLPVIGTAPVSPLQGDMYFDSGIAKIRVYNGSGWVNIPGVGGGGGTVSGTISAGTFNAALTSFVATLNGQSVGAYNNALAYTTKLLESVGSSNNSALALSQATLGSQSAGSNNNVFGLSLATLSARNLGSYNNAMAFSSQLLEAIGNYNNALALSNAGGNGTQSTGSNNNSLGLSQATLSARNAGTDSIGAWTASSTIIGSRWVGTATAVSRGGSADWTTTANAQGQFDDAIATITTQGVASGSMADDLKLTAFNIPAITSGFTRTKVELLIRHLWDTGGSALESCNFTVTLRKTAANAIVATVLTYTNNTLSQATLLTETFDLTSACSGLTDAEIQALQVWCQADSANLAVLQDGFLWSVDGIQLRITYAKTGIS